jgi:hypothetical protein
VNGTCASLVLTDGYPFKAPSDFTATAATYTTTISTAAQAGTLCLPFAATIPQGVTAYTLTYQSGDNATATEVETTIPANTPVLLNGSGEVTLGELYDSKKDALNTQFNLPAGYHKFENQRQFIDYYPFVPYQFTLMTKVFDAFVTQDYVDREVSGSERSIIKVTHSTAKDTKDQAVGDLVSFDQFFNGMFQGSLKTKALKTIEVATKVIEEYSGDKEFAMRVLNILFMICNMAEEDKVVFAANVDNISCLLMRDIDTNKLALKNKVQLILNYLCDSNIIRIETSRNGVESYNFYSEDERKVADAIKGESIDRDTMATQLAGIIKIP